MDWEIKQKRNALLAATDWTQLSDSPFSIEKKQEWTDYRQKLRDLPSQESPFNFPLEPQA